MVLGWWPDVLNAGNAFLPGLDWEVEYAVASTDDYGNHVPG